MKQRATERAEDRQERQCVALMVELVAIRPVHMATEWGTVIVNTYSVHATYTYLYLTGFHIACMISLQIFIESQHPQHRESDLTELVI